jgi:hypothetical protein
MNLEAVSTIRDVPILSGLAGKWGRYYKVGKLQN